MLTLLVLLAGCGVQKGANLSTGGGKTSLLCAKSRGNAHGKRIVMGDERTKDYLPLIEGQRVALLTNHTGLAGTRADSPHILDVLLKKKVDVDVVFSPEHGLRGTADAGEKVESGRDPKTGVPVVSLYGAGGKPDPETFDVLLVDIQDVGTRFYTYYITMLRMMDLCADSGKQVIILDRPNPNGFTVDGPILDQRFKSGVGALPIPVMHGMTLGELAQMIVGEGWLSSKRRCNLLVIPCLNYTHSTLYDLPVAPSPNLKDMQAIYLYPSTCLFEGTTLSLGRGTDWPFEVYGHPSFPETGFAFTPKSVPGAKNPPLKDQECKGVDLRSIPQDVIRYKGLDLSYIVDAHKSMAPSGEAFWNGNFFELLIGVDYVRKMIEAGAEAEEIEARWEDDVNKFITQRAKYLIYE